MRKLYIRLTIIFLFLFCGTAFATQYYVYIDKIGKVDVGEEAGQNAIGDVVGIYPKTLQYKPTRSELSRYHVIVVDLTRAQRNQLVEPIRPETDEVITKARKRTVDYESLPNQAQEAVIDISDLLLHISIKP